jgi:uracil-xanthine permease
MFGATFLVPLLTGFPPATTLFFSALGTIGFLLITRNRVPSYLGSSFAFIAPITAATAAHNGSLNVAVGGVLATGITLAIIGVVVHLTGGGWIDTLMPPIVTGTIVALIGLNLAPAAWNNFSAAPITAVITLAAIILSSVLFKGLLGRLSILVGVIVGYIAAVIQGQVDFSGVGQAGWIGFPQFHHPVFDPNVLGLFLPVVLVLVAENVGHVKSVAAMTGRNLDTMTGRALLADGVGTSLAGLGGGSGTTTYAENIGVMAATRVYSTAAYWVAAVFALALSLFPKVGELIATIPVGVLGGAGTMLYGMIGILGARIWVQSRVDFSSPINLTTAAIPLVIGIANFTWVIGDLTFEGIALGTASALVIYHLMKWISRLTGAQQEPATPASVPGGSELEQPSGH